MMNICGQRTPPPPKGDGRDLVISGPGSPKLSLTGHIQRRRRIKRPTERGEREMRELKTVTVQF